MRTEESAVESPTRTLPLQISGPLLVAEELENVKIRVVSLGELGPLPAPSVSEPDARGPRDENARGPMALAEAQPSASPPVRAAAFTRTSAGMPAAGESVRSRRLLDRNRVGFISMVGVLYLGWRMPTERYIVPTRGLGYALGIVGGSLMLLLLMYSARKHFSWLRFLGPTPAWFRFHMVLGILGPL